MVAAAAMGAALSPGMAVAQGPMPPYAHAPSPQAAETIRGRIASINGSNLEVNDERGFVDRVRLEQGTVVNPAGLTLQPGMNVTISGYSTGDFFTANVIDAPYRPQAANPPAYAYPTYPAYPAYPYPAYPPYVVAPYPVYAYPPVGVYVGPRFGFRFRWR